MPATAAYAVLLGRLDDADVTVALTALWAIERAYLDAWSFAAPGAPAYREFVAHWTTPQFAAYVDALEQAADDAVGAALGGSDLDAVFAEVVDAESDFWAMALRDMTWTEQAL
jgi:thiaminase/transcriptional activator TenA